MIAASAPASSAHALRAAPVVAHGSNTLLKVLTGAGVPASRYSTTRLRYSTTQVPRTARIRTQSPRWLWCASIQIFYYQAEIFYQRRCHVRRASELDPLSCNHPPDKCCKRKEGSCGTRTRCERRKSSSARSSGTAGAQEQGRQLGLAFESNFLRHTHTSASVANEAARVVVAPKTLKNKAESWLWPSDQLFLPSLSRSLSLSLSLPLKHTHTHTGLLSLY